MNLENRESESENKPSITKQAPASQHAFEWPDDQQSVASPTAVNVKWIRGEHLASWATFWFATWTGTTIAGSLFGGAIGLIGLANSSVEAPFVGLFLGALWAGAVGLLVFVHLGVIYWMLWRLSNPLTVGTIAGALTGAICGLVILSVFTGPLGAIGAHYAGTAFLKSTKGKSFLETIKTIQNESLGSMRFSMMDLFLRVTVLAVFLAGWTAWIRSF